MSYALLYDVPADEQMYQRVKAAIGDEQPTGLVVHSMDGGRDAFVVEALPVRW
jgi:hypothetical protein